MKLSPRQKEFKLNLEQKIYAEHLLDSFGFDKSVKYLHEEIDYLASTHRYLKAELYFQLVIHIRNTHNDQNANKESQQ